jgi:Helix-turn-helix domain
MPLEKYDVLLAFKVIGLSDKLNSTEKQVAAALIDSYNRRTGRCDPSLETLAVWLGKSRRTVIRAVDRVVKLRFFRKIRHGGNNHCNSYVPQWDFYRSVERSYKQRRQEYANRFARQEMSPSTGQPCHSSGDNVGTQTCPNNNIQLTYERCPSKRQHHHLNGEGLGNGSAVSSSARALNSVFLDPPTSKEAACLSAERRWNKELLDRFRHMSLYATILEALDHDLQVAATQAEVKRVGTGLKYILQELIRRRVLSAMEI